MRQSTAAFAVITRDNNGVREWLAQWNRAWNAYNLVGGHRHEDESYRECLIREIEEELGFELSTDYEIVGVTSLPVEYTAWSERAKEDTQYHMELFPVILTPDALVRVENNPDNRWLTWKEIESDRTNDGRPVSPTLMRLVKQMRIPRARPRRGRA